MYKHIEKAYFKQMAYYKLYFVDKRIENPEEVVVNDTDIVCTEVSEMVEILIGTVIDGTYFTWRLSKVTSPKWASVAVGYVLH